MAIDGDVRVRESTESLLESAGYTGAVVLLSGGISGIWCAAAVDCLITDVRTPEISGIELQRHVRLRRPELAVILTYVHHDDDAGDGLSKRVRSPFFMNRSMP